MTHRKILTVLLALVMAASVLAACDGRGKTENTYTVTFDLDGGTMEEETSATVEKGTVSDAAFAREGGI